MPKKEKTTDLLVWDMLKSVGLSDFSAQGSSIMEIDKALATASKKGTGKHGCPEYVGVVKDFLIVIEDKVSLNNHIRRDDKNLIAEDNKICCSLCV
ncbi:hypothetical protein KJY77_02170 [Canibacter sp. lx-72]|uniref:hypothetical protein n=1 Tax=Canibacter zhuwentaonis TaxID=2837491 RepID=UPI001BDC6B49|nr:hypothetical protein [Canibacter zhuwentaonis]MBT1017949.1 hypothetical protein [Canibacter zhuwentaonis]